MKVFITGASGFVGRHLLPELLREGHDISCLLRSSGKNLDGDLFSRCRIVRGDVTDRNSLRGSMNEMDMVIHLAVVTPLTNKNNDADLYESVNVSGTKHVLEECIVANPKRILCFSSTAAIGRPKRDIIDENTPLEPINSYGRSKKTADELVKGFIKNLGLPILTICFPHIYGPGDAHEFLGIIKMIKKGVLPQIGFSPNLLPQVYISDAVQAIILAMSKGKTGEKYIIADDDPHDLREIRKLALSALEINRNLYPFLPKYSGIAGAALIEKVFGILGLKPPVTSENIKSIVAGRRLSNQKAKKDLGFTPQVTLEEGIRNTILWYKNHNML